MTTEKTTCTSSLFWAFGKSRGNAGATMTLAVTMRMMSNTSVMSTSGVTLMPTIMPLPCELAPAMALTVAPPYYDHPAYIRALVASASEYLKEGYEHLLFSFHGIPERHLRKSDPTGGHCLIVKECCVKSSPALATCYRAQCLTTAREFVKAAGVPEHKYFIAFQSRLGRDPWLKPQTDAILERLGGAGVKKLLVICPSFVSDCLETLEEIGLRGRETFRRAGGGELTLIPCLNQHPLWLDALETMVSDWTGGSGAPRSEGNRATAGAGK